MGDISATRPALGDANPGVDRVVRGILISGSIAGVVDIFAASAINQIDPSFILQIIASGLLGKASFHGGAMTIGFGFVLQLAMSLIIAAIYGLAGARLPLLVRKPVSMGALFGVGVFVVMTFVVMPLSAAPHPKHAPSVSAIGLNLAAMILFGLIVSVVQSRAVTRRG